MTLYLLDTNIFIQAYEATYRIGEFPGVWDWLAEAADQRQIASIVNVREEITKDVDLQDWVDTQLPADFFRPNTDAVREALQEVGDWIERSGLYASRQRKENFKRKADAYLIAHGLARGNAIVTYEKPDNHKTAAARRIKIPDVADALGVECIPLHDLFRALGATFILGPTRR